MKCLSFTDLKPNFQKLHTGAVATVNGETKHGNIITIRKICCRDKMESR